MRKQILLCLAVLIALNSCNDKKTVPNTDIDVARAFITDIMDNNFADAQPLMLADDANKGFLDVTKRTFNSYDPSKLQSYRDADIIFNEVKNVNDSVTLIDYSNSFERTTKEKLKLVKLNGIWQVDLKYTFMQ